MRKCAFLTLAERDGWFIDDELVHEPLRRLGWEVCEVVWHEPVDWNRFDVVVIRSPWDYQREPQRFLSVLSDIEASSAALYNSPATVAWNLEKTYLLDLESRGVEIVPTLVLAELGGSEIQHLLTLWNSPEIIVKPTIGATADDTFRVGKRTGAAQLNEICARFAQRPCLAQPFMRAIVEEGEFSLIYFDGQLSHSILKTVRKGDFRVQEEHGGGVVSISTPEPALLRAAELTMAALPDVPLYARVDLVRTSNDTFALMELELIEPCLYFRFGPDSAARFALAIDRRCSE